jgi:hypothetical protein
MPETTTGPMPPASRTSVVWWLGVGLLAVALWWLYWLRFSAPLVPAAPLWKHTLPGGLELRLVGTHYPNSKSDDFNGRVFIDPNASAPLMSMKVSRDLSTAWMIFSLCDSQTNRFAVPDLEFCDVLESKGPVRFRGMPLSGRDELPPVQTVAFASLPRREAQLKLHFKLAGLPAMNATIPNPHFAPAAPTWTPEPVPTTKGVGGMQFELKSVTVSRVSKRDERGAYDELGLDAQVAVRMPGVEQEPFVADMQFVDPTGNEFARGILPIADPVWGVRVLAFETVDMPYPDERRWSLGSVVIPGPGQMTRVPVPAAMSKFGVVEILLLGVGQFWWRDGVVSASAPGVKEKSPAGKLEFQGRGFALSELLAIRIISTQEDPLKSAAGSMVPAGEKSVSGRIRGRAGDQPFYFGYHGGGSGSGAFDDKFRLLGQTVPKPGGMIELEIVFPRTRSAEFHFERPKLPGE